MPLDQTAINSIKPGLTARVHTIIREKNAKGEEKERLQVFEGMVLAVKHGQGVSGTFTIRKVSDGIGVERIFPLHSPMISKLEPLRQAQVRRAKLYFLREHKKRMKETRLSPSTQLGASAGAVRLSK